jgi:hypothetical protein
MNLATISCGIAADFKRVASSGWCPTSTRVSNASMASRSRL